MFFIMRRKTKFSNKALFAKFAFYIICFVVSQSKRKIGVYNM